MLNCWQIRVLSIATTITYFNNIPETENLQFYRDMKQGEIPLKVVFSVFQKYKNHVFKKIVKYNVSRNFVD